MQYLVDNEKEWGVNRNLNMNLENNLLAIVPLLSPQITSICDSPEILAESLAPIFLTRKKGGRGGARRSSF